MSYSITIILYVKTLFITPFGEIIDLVLQSENAFDGY